MGIQFPSYAGQAVHSSVWLKPGLELNRAARTIPGDKFIFQGVRQNAVCACALRAASLRLEGEQRTSVATSLALILAAPGGAGGGGLTVLLPLLLIPVLYFVMIRPQQKRQKQWQSMLGSIKTGDRVTTAGGIRGIIMSIKDDTIVIRVAPDNIKLEVAKNAIASVTQEDTSAS
jgi:preprotein translocase subunit YajC